VTDPRIRERRVAVARAAGRRRLRFVLAGAGFMVLAVGALMALHSSLFSARHISVYGSAGLSRHEVILTSGLSGDPPLIDVNPARAAANLEQLPTVAKASVTVRWPDSVDIRLTGRVGVVMVPVTAAVSPEHTAHGGSGTAATAAGAAGFGSAATAGAGSAATAGATAQPPTSYAVIDKSGRVLGVAAHPPAGLPVVLAGSFVGRPGSFLKPAGEALVDVALALGAGLAAKVAAVGYDEAGGIAVSLKTGQAAILGGTGLLAQKMVSLATVLHDVALGNVATIDLSSPSSPVLTPIGAGRSVVLVAGG
jgi:cell division septal protein FtsQ